LQQQIDHGLSATVAELGYAQLARTAFYEQARRFMERFDVLVTPQMPCVAWPVDAPPASIGGRPTPRLFDRLQFTFPFNLTGCPASLRSWCPQGRGGSSPPFRTDSVYFEFKITVFGPRITQLGVTVGGR